jgi:hypothetical protein
VWGGIGALRLAMMIDFLGSVRVGSVNWDDLVCIQYVDAGLGWTRLTDLNLRQARD